MAVLVRVPFQRLFSIRFLEVSIGHISADAERFVQTACAESKL
jgi:hypothetical protein